LIRGRRRPPSPTVGRTGKPSEVVPLSAGVRRSGPPSRPGRRPPGPEQTRAGAAPALRYSNGTCHVRGGWCRVSLGPLPREWTGGCPPTLRFAPLPNDRKSDRRLGDVVGPPPSYRLRRPRRVGLHPGRFTLGCGCLLMDGLSAGTNSEPAPCRPNYIRRLHTFEDARGERRGYGGARTPKRSGRREGRGRCGMARGDNGHGRPKVRRGRAATRERVDPAWRRARSGGRRRRRGGEPDRAAGGRGGSPAMLEGRRAVRPERAVLPEADRPNLQAAEPAERQRGLLQPEGRTVWRREPERPCQAAMLLPPPVQQQKRW
jgi:hypothetical protein